MNVSREFGDIVISNMGPSNIHYLKIDTYKLKQTTVNVEIF